MKKSNLKLSNRKVKFCFLKTSQKIEFKNSNGTQKIKILDWKFDLKKF